MRIKRDDDSSAVMLSGMLLGGHDDLPMSEVNSVENADCKGQRAVDGGESVDRAKNLHGASCSLYPQRKEIARRRTKPPGEGYFRLLRVLQKDFRRLAFSSFRVLVTLVWSVPTRVFITSP